MTTIVIKLKDSGKVIAKGKVGKEVQIMEGNYYFNPDVVDLSDTNIEKEAYTCPIKRAPCDYYFFKDESGENFSREACWIYDSIPNTLFKSIEGCVGFYTKPPINGLEVEVVENGSSI